MKSLVRLFVFTIFFALPAAAYSQAPRDVAQTLHNLSVWGARSASDTSEICVFCHTPHSSNPQWPLWNHYSSTSAKTFRLYTASGTLSDEVRLNSSLPDDSASMLCLSCHEGTTALNALVNPAGDLGRNPTMTPGMEDIQTIIEGVYGPVGEGFSTWIGANLTNMHPIGFDYNAVASVEPTEFQSITNAKSAGLKFYGGVGSLGQEGQRLECATCHDPHVYTGRIGDTAAPVGDEYLERYWPFLRSSNASSILCLTCHIK